MKYYCKSCGAILEPGKATERRGFPMLCPWCNRAELKEIPDYETPEQYEKRTGEPWPDNAPVWMCLEKKWSALEEEEYSKSKFRWSVLTFKSAKALDTRRKQVKFFIVCAQGPKTPGDDWNPEEAEK